MWKKDRRPEVIFVGCRLLAQRSGDCRRTWRQWRSVSCLQQTVVCPTSARGAILQIATSGGAVLKKVKAGTVGTSVAGVDCGEMGRRMQQRCRTGERIPGGPSTQPPVKQCVRSEARR